MKFFSEKTYHLLFDWGIVLKAIWSAGEILLGIALTFWSYASIQQLAIFLTGDELTEAPRDFFWNLLARGTHTFTVAPESFWAFLFISHGALKGIVSWFLAKEKMWAFPLGIAVFAGFVVYEIYQLTYLNSAVLWLTVVFDLALIVIIIHEWREKRKAMATTYL